MTGPSIKIDPKTRKVVSADYGIDYAAELKGAKALLAKIVKIDMGVRRTLKMIGVSNSRPLKDADHKKIAAQKNAAALIEEFEDAGIQIAGSAYLFANTATAVRKEEALMAKEMFSAVEVQSQGQMDTLEKDIKAAEKKLWEMKQELAKLEDAKKDYVKQIQAVTGAASQSFYKELTAIRAEAEKLGSQYAPNGPWSFTLSRKYMKK